VIYLKWKLSDGASGSGPEETITDRGGSLEPSPYVDSSGYRIGYLTTSADLTDLEDWDVTEVTEAEALAFAQALWVDAEVAAGGYLSSVPPVDEAD
jgi:hypothetical protein